MNKDVLVALIAKDVNELQTLTEGLDQMEMIPAPYLRLALDKSKALTANIESLVNYLDNKEIEDKQEAQRQADLEAKQAEEAAREAELARIAEEQEALFKAEELETNSWKILDSAILISYSLNLLYMSSNASVGKLILSMW